MMEIQKHMNILALLYVNSYIILRDCDDLTHNVLLPHNLND